MTRALEESIRFHDGRRGVQYVTLDEDGNRTLTGVLVTHRADGSPCRVVYDRRPDLACLVFSLSELHGATWEVAT